MALIWYVMSWMKGGKAPPPGPDGSPAALPQALLPRFGGKGVGFDMSVYMSESSHLGIRFDPSELIWTEHDVPFAVGAVRELAYEYIPSLVRTKLCEHVILPSACFLASNHWMWPTLSGS